MHLRELSMLYRVISTKRAAYAAFPPHGPNEAVTIMRFGTS